MQLSPNTCFCKESSIETQPLICFVYVCLLTPLAELKGWTLQWKCHMAPESKMFTLLSSQKVFANPLFSVLDCFQI